LKGVQDINGLDESGDVDDAKCARGFSHSDFSNSLTNARHRFPIVRTETALNTIELKSGIAARTVWECA
jgi:hypothetical protein